MTHRRGRRRFVGSRRQTSVGDDLRNRNRRPPPALLVTPAPPPGVARSMLSPEPSSPTHHRRSSNPQDRPSPSSSATARSSRRQSSRPSFFQKVFGKLGRKKKKKKASGRRRRTTASSSSSNQHLSTRADVPGKKSSLLRKVQLQKVPLRPLGPNVFAFLQSAAEEELLEESEPTIEDDDQQTTTRGGGVRPPPPPMRVPPDPPQYCLDPYSRIPFSDIHFLNEVGIVQHKQRQHSGRGRIGMMNIQHYDFLLRGSWKARDVVVKVYRVDAHTDIPLELIFREVNTHRILKHPHVLEYFGVSLTVDDRFIGLVARFCPYGDLEYFIGEHPDVPLSERIRILAEIASAISYLHVSKKVIHRDVKPENVFIDVSVSAKLGDMSLARRCRTLSESKTAMVGSQAFMAPEMADDEYDFRADVYSFAITMYAVLTGQMSPYYSHCRGQIPQDLHLHVAANPSLRPDVLPLQERLAEAFCCDEETQALLIEQVTTGWSHDPEARPSCAQLQEVLRRIQEELESDTDSSKCDSYEFASDEFFVPNSEVVEASEGGRSVFVTVDEEKGGGGKGDPTRPDSSLSFESCRHLVTIGPKIAEGAYGKVFSGQFCQGMRTKEIVVKEIFIKSSRQIQMLLKEVRVLQELHASSTESPSQIVKCYGCWIEDSVFHIVFERCSDGTLLEWLRARKAEGSLTPLMKLDCLIQLAEGIRWIHSRRLVHYDLKPDNVLMSGTQLKLCDFGLSKHLGSMRSEEIRGTVGYIPNPATADLGLPESFDIYAFGILCFEIWAVKIAYSSLRAQVAPGRAGQQQLLETIHERNIRPDFATLQKHEDEDEENTDDSSPPEALVWLASRCWDDNPAVRPTALQILAELKAIKKRLLPAETRKSPADEELLLYVRSADQKDSDARDFVLSDLSLAGLKSAIAGRVGCQVEDIQEVKKVTTRGLRLISSDEAVRRLENEMVLVL